MKYIKRASNLGNDDALIHTEIAIFLIDNRLFAEGQKELEKATFNYKKSEGFYENWGYYYHKMGDYDKAIKSFQKALILNQNNFGNYNNLGYALYEAGRREEAYRSFQRSLAIEPNQSNLREFLKNYGFNQETRKQESDSRNNGK